MKKLTEIKREIMTILDRLRLKRKSIIESFRKKLEEEKISEIKGSLNKK